MSVDHLISRFRSGFPPGHTDVTREGEARLDTGVDFGIHRFRGGEAFEETHPKETAWLLLDGEADVEWGSEQARVRRASLFDEAPTALHVPGGTRVALRTHAKGSEWAVVRAANERRFAAKLFRAEELKPEYRGEGLVHTAAGVRAGRRLRRVVRGRSQAGGVGPDGGPGRGVRCVAVSAGRRG